MQIYSKREKPKRSWVVVVALLLGLGAIGWACSKLDSDKPVEEKAGLNRPQPQLPEDGVSATTDDRTHVILEFFPNMEGIECLTADERPSVDGLLKKMNVRGPIWKDLKLTVGRTADYEDQFCVARSINNGPVRCECHSTPLPAGGAPSSDTIDEVVVPSTVEE